MYVCVCVCVYIYIYIYIKLVVVTWQQLREDPGGVAPRHRAKRRHAT